MVTDVQPQGRRRSRRLWWLAAIALAVASALSVAPGLTGDWVYDDLQMVGNPLYDDAADVVDS